MGQWIHIILIRIRIRLSSKYSIKINVLGRTWCFIRTIQWNIIINAHRNISRTLVSDTDPHPGISYTDPHPGIPDTDHHPGIPNKDPYPAILIRIRIQVDTMMRNQREGGGGGGSCFGEIYIPLPGHFPTIYSQIYEKKCLKSLDKFLYL